MREFYICNLTHTVTAFFQLIRYDDGDVRHYDLTLKMFNILPGGSARQESLPWDAANAEPMSCFETLLRHRELPASFENNLKNHYARNAWWQCRKRYLAYLSCLLQLSPLLEPPGCGDPHQNRWSARSNINLVNEFLHLALLFSTPDARTSRRLCAPMSSIDDDRDYALGNKLLYDATFFCVDSEAMHSSSYAAVLGRTAVEEKIRNAVIIAKRESCEPLDFEAWIVRYVAFVGGDAHALDSTRIEFYRERWDRYTAMDAPTYHYTSAQGDFQLHRLGSKLQQFECEMAESLVPNDELLRFPLNGGYRSAWGPPNASCSEGRQLLEAWVAAHDREPLGMALASSFDHGPSTRELLMAIDCILAGAVGGPYVFDTSFAALLCLKFHHWGGLLVLCEHFIHMLGDKKAPRSKPSCAIVYEYLRLIVITACCHNEDSVAIQPFAEYVVTTALYLLCRLSDVTRADDFDAMETRRMPQLELGAGVDYIQLTASERLACGVLHDAFATSSGSGAVLVSSLTKPFIDVFGVERGLILITYGPWATVPQQTELLHGQELLRTVGLVCAAWTANEGDASRSLANLRAQVQADAARGVHRGGDRFLASAEDDELVAAWGSCVDGSDACSHCAAPLEATGSSSDRESAVVLRCGHGCHTSCAATSEDCPLCLWSSPASTWSLLGE